MRHYIILVVTAALAGAVFFGCQQKTAKAEFVIDPYEDNPGWDQWFEQMVADDFEQTTDLSVAGRYPWCDELDSYYFAGSIWEYKDGQFANGYSEPAFCYLQPWDHFCIVR